MTMTKITPEIPTATKPYSIVVTADLSFKKAKSLRKAKSLSAVEVPNIGVKELRKNALVAKSKL